MRMFLIMIGIFYLGFIWGLLLVQFLSQKERKITKQRVKQLLQNELEKTKLSEEDKKIVIEKQIAVYQKMDLLDEDLISEYRMYNSNQPPKSQNNSSCTRGGNVISNKINYYQ